MKNALPYVFTIFIASFGYSQQNTVSSGSDGTGTGGTFSYSIGQIDYTNTSGALNVTEGVQQPYEFYEVVGIDEIGSIATSIYPNPTTESVTLEISELRNDYSYSVFDLKGRLITFDKITQLETIVDLKQFAAGTYILEISQAVTPLTTLKIIKH